MKNDQTSGTALGVTIVRAVHQLIDDPPHILDDPVSLLLIGTAGKERILGEPEKFGSPSSKALRSHVVLRSRYAEDSLSEAIPSGIRQFIALGAGYDTFALRQPVWARGLKIVEVDHPATQASKLDLLERRNIEIPENVSFVPLDLEKEELGAGLAGSGFDPGLPVFVACLGVLAYLHVESVHRIFKWAGALPRLSRFVFTFATNAEAQSALSETTAAKGEAWHARFDIEGLQEVLRGAGFREIVFVPPEEGAARYFAGRKDLPPPQRVTMGQAVV